MKLIFDARLMANQYTGLARYTGALLKALIETATNPTFKISVLLHTDVSWRDNIHYQAIAPLLDKKNREVIEIPTAPLSVRQHLSVASHVNRYRADHYFYPHFDVPLGITPPTTFVVHDLIPLIVPNYIGRFSWLKKQYFSQMLKLNVKNAKQCFAVSNATRKDLIHLIGSKHSEKISVAGEGSVLPDSLKDYPLPLELSSIEKYLLYVGDRRPHKNLRRVIDLFALLRNHHGYRGNLVLIGSTQNYDFDLDVYIANRTDVRVAGHVSDEDLAACYAHADALIFLSDYEGFGLPVVEAARYNRKMLLSDGGALSEIAPSDTCILPRTMPLEDAADRAAHYLSCDSPVDYSGYNQRFSWIKAARTIFPEAYSDLDM